MLSRRLCIVAFLLFDCGGALGYDDSLQATGGRHNAGGAGGTPNTWLDAGLGGTSTGGQVYSTYTGQGCPQTTVPSVDAACDIFSADSGCPDGYGCFPIVRSTNDPCQPASYSFLCVYAGSGSQGDDCDQLHRCGPGYVCVVTSIGTQCEQVCDTSQPSSCAPGMFCDPIDVPGVGTCS
jgi:hypothetical protein